MAFAAGWRLLVDAGSSPDVGPRAASASRREASLALERLKKRAEFLRAAKGRRVVRAGFVLQARQRDDEDPARVGFTASRKVGNAVVRNRSKRRLRELARLELAPRGLRGTDFVLIARQGTAKLPFTKLRADLATALAAVTAR